jgi:hypothetical protein
MFKIDFFELAFLAEACIPERPIARTMFWHNLTDKYWEQMTPDERERLFDWMNKTDVYQESLKKHEDTQVFNARFDPDNQYLVNTFHNVDHHAFMYKGKHYIGRNTWIPKEFIKSKNKI